MDQLFFYSKSRDVVPGTGAHERVADLRDYDALRAIPEWRKVLSNFHRHCEFTYHDHRYNTIEHVFQAEKIRLADSERAFWFTVDSGHPIGQGDGALAQKNRKLVRLTPEQLAHWNSIKSNVMEEAAISKFSTCTHARDVLMATGTAELWHIVPRQKPVRFIHLERIREHYRSRIN